MRSRIHCTILGTLLAFSGSTVAQEASEAAPVAASVEAEANTEATVPAADTAASANHAAAATNGTIGQPQSGKGQIVFFRPSKLTGAAIGFKVREGDTELGKLRNGKYFIAQVDPGTHQYTVHSEAKDVLTMEVEEGETYYVQGTITMGFMAGRPNLSPSDQATFDGMAGKLKLAE